MRRKVLLDETDRRIIALLYERPDITQLEVSQKLRLSQSTIALRLGRLKNEDLLRMSVALNFRKLGLSLARIDISTKDIKPILSFAKKCPLCANGTWSVGTKNASLYLLVEDPEALSYVVDEHLRRLTDVTDVDFNLISHTVEPFCLRVETLLQEASTPPCGIEPFCPDCPVNPEYKGRFWKNNPHS